jgi:hypothetical protein
MYNTLYELGISLLEFLPILQNRINDLKKEVEQIDAKKQQVLKDCDMTLELLQEYNANKPFVLRLQKYKQQLLEKEQQLVEVENRRKLEKEVEYAIHGTHVTKYLHGHFLNMSLIRSKQSLSLNLK